MIEAVIIFLTAWLNRFRGSGLLFMGWLEPRTPKDVEFREKYRIDLPGGPSIAPGLAVGLIFGLYTLSWQWGVLVGLGYIFTNVWGWGNYVQIGRGINDPKGEIGWIDYVTAAVLSRGTEAERDLLAITLRYFYVFPHCVAAWLLLHVPIWHAIEAFLLVLCGVAASSWISYSDKVWYSRVESTTLDETLKGIGWGAHFLILTLSVPHV